MSSTTTAQSIHKQRCRGATVIETAFVLPMLLFILFAFLDLGLAAVRQNSLRDASRQLARQAIIRGSLCPDNFSSWGPEEIQDATAQDAPYIEILQTALPTMPLDEVKIGITWPEGTNLPGDLITVEVRFDHNGILPGILPWGPLSLSSRSSMQIVN